MSKAVLISIRPKWCEKICSGEKIIEVRKTRPKMKTPFKCYIYCTSGRPDLNIPISPERLMRDYLDTGSMKSLNCPLGNGKVIGEFVCDAYVTDKTFGHDALFNAAACMNESDVVAYSAGSPIYGWHISNLKIYDPLKKLSEFSPVCMYKNDDKSCQSRMIACSYQKYDYNPDGSINLVECGRTLERPPQSWCYVEEVE